MNFLRTTLMLLLVLGYLLLPELHSWQPSPWYLTFLAWGILIVITAVAIRPLRSDDDV